MSTKSTLDPSSPLSPSELVLLNGEQFANYPKWEFGKRGFGIKLLHLDAVVSVSQLVEAILACAFLAAEEAGNIRFEVRKDTIFSSLKYVDNLYANPTPAPIEWPTYSLEAQLPRLAAQSITTKEGPKVSNLIQTWLEKDSSDPWETTIEMVKSGLAKRDLMKKRESKYLWIFTVTDLTLPKKTLVLAKDQPIEPIKNLIANCKSKQRDIWDLLMKQIDQAIKARTEETYIPEQY